MLWISDTEEELDIPEEDDEDTAIGDDALDALADEEDEDEADEDTGEGFGHIDEEAAAEKLKVKATDEDEEEDEDEPPLEEDAEDVDYDSFDDVDEF